MRYFFAQVQSYAKIRCTLEETGKERYTVHCSVQYRSQLIESAEQFVKHPDHLGSGTVLRQRRQTGNISHEHTTSHTSAHDHTRGHGKAGSFAAFVRPSRSRLLRRRRNIQHAWNSSSSLTKHALERKSRNQHGRRIRRYRKS